MLVIAGPTATGKTGLAIRIAEALAEEGTPAEIISADSRQVYRGMDVGTAKATAEERARVPHYGLDLVDPDEAFTVADFVEHATAALDAIAGRGAIALLVGGTGLYLRAVAGGIDLGALPWDPVLRGVIEADLVRDGLPALAARLRAAAPTFADRVDLQNPRRVTRALEIALLRGDAPLPVPRGYPGPVAWVGLDLDRETHRQWISNRAVGQLDGGLLEEATRLRSRYPETLRSFSAIGYREAFDLLDERIDRATFLEVNTRRNRELARRQRTWFRRETAIRWLDAGGEPLAEALGAARALASASTLAGRIEKLAGR